MYIAINYINIIITRFPACDGTPEFEIGHSVVASYRPEGLHQDNTQASHLIYNKKQYLKKVWPRKTCTVQVLRGVGCSGCWSCQLAGSPNSVTASLHVKKLSTLVDMFIVIQL